MLNSDVLSVLSQLNLITNSVILQYPKTTAVSETQDILASVDLSQFDLESFPEIALNNSLSDFLNIFKLFDKDRIVSMVDDTIHISDSVRDVDFITYSKDLMTAFDKDDAQIVKTETVPSVAEFNLTVQDIKEIRNAGSVFKNLDDVIISSVDGELKIQLGNISSFNAKSNTFAVKKTGSTNKNFSIAVPRDNFAKIPVSEYTLTVRYNEARDSYRILLSNNSISDFKILMSVKTA